MNSQNSIPQYSDHSRDWRTNKYVYPVISRRSGGLSIGVNLSPSGACNFGCVYCQVDRTSPRKTNKVNVDDLRAELEAMISEAASGEIFKDPAFAGLPQDKQVVRDIAFSGDGEPTAGKHFLECVELAANLKAQANLDDVSIVLITNACYLAKPEVESALAIMYRNNGQVWAKLDAGTEEYFRQINRANFSLEHVIENIIAASMRRRIVIQSMFLRYDGKDPSEAELAAYIDRLRQIVSSGGQIDYVQIYTVARRPAEDIVEPLPSEKVEYIANLVRTKAGLQAEVYC